MSRSYQFGGYGGGGINQPDIQPSAERVQIPNDVRGNEGKAAKAMVGHLDKLSFDSIHFAHMLVALGGSGMRRRILDVAINIIKTYALEYETGVSRDEAARDAMRLKDTCDQFKM